MNEVFFNYNEADLDFLSHFTFWKTSTGIISLTMTKHSYISISKNKPHPFEKRHKTKYHGYDIHFYLFMFIFPSHLSVSFPCLRNYISYLSCSKQCSIVPVFKSVNKNNIKHNFLTIIHNF